MNKNRRCFTLFTFACLALLFVLTPGCEPADDIAISGPVAIFEVSLPSERPVPPGGSRPTLEEWEIAFETLRLSVTDHRLLKDAIDRELVRHTAWHKSFMIGTGQDGLPVYDLAAAVDDLRKRTIVKRLGNSNRFVISVNVPSPADSIKLAEMLSATFMQHIEGEVYNQDEAVRRVLIQERDRLEEISSHLANGISRFIREAAEKEDDSWGYQSELRMLKQNAEPVAARIAKINNLLDDMRVYRNRPDSKRVRLVEVLR